VRNLDESKSASVDGLTAGFNHCQRA
jgi:hypothetical protein